MRGRWKIIGLAGAAGVAATGVVVAHKRRSHVDYEPDELRARLHQRLTQTHGDETDASIFPAQPPQDP